MVYYTELPATALSLAFDIVDATALTVKNAPRFISVISYHLPISFSYVAFRTYLLISLPAKG